MRSQISIDINYWELGSIPRVDFYIQCSDVRQQSNECMVRHQGDRKT